MHIPDRPAIRPEEHPSSRVRRPQRLDGHEHHQQGEEGDQVARTANKLRSGKHSSVRKKLPFNFTLLYSVIESGGLKVEFDKIESQDRKYILQKFTREIRFCDQMLCLCLH